MDEDRRDRTLWCGGLDRKVTKKILWELFVQAGPLEDVKIPRESTGHHMNFAFVNFVHAESVGYAMALMHGVSLNGRYLRLGRRPQATVDDTYLDVMKRYYERVTSRRPRGGICDRFQMPPLSFMMHQQQIPSRFRMHMTMNLPPPLTPVSTPAQHHYVPTPIHKYVPTPIRNSNPDASTSHHSAEQQEVPYVPEYFTMKSNGSRQRPEEPLKNYQCSQTSEYSEAYQATGSSYRASGDGYSTSGDDDRASGSCYNAASDGYHAASDEYHSSGVRHYRRNDYSGHEGSYDHHGYHAKRRRY